MVTENSHEKWLFFWNSFVKEAGPESFPLLGRWQSDILRYLSKVDHQLERNLSSLPSVMMSLPLECIVLSLVAQHHLEAGRLRPVSGRCKCTYARTRTIVDIGSVPNLQ